jgi:tRNA modification GTPase
MISPNDTIVAIATPLGEGGIGVIRVSGQAALELAAQIFQPAKSIDLSKAPSHTCYFGTVDAIDEVVVTVFRAPHSYTGEDVIEISAHGSPFILQKILALCIHKGARLAGPGEFTERAFLHGKMDLTQAEAVADLIRAKTDKSQSAALAQVQGSLAQKVRGLKAKLLPLLAHLEVGLDHSDEDHNFLKRDGLISACQSAEEEIDEILASAKTSKVLREGFRVALLGRPNVGKSSLMNSLLKEERAIVTPIAGTTRDTLEETLSIEGIPVILTDTAGLRTQTSDPVEKLGIERTRKSLDEADFVIGLFDGSETLTEEDKQVIAAALQKPHLWVINKTDLPARLNAASLHTMNGGAPIVSLSTKTGQGLADLVSQIARHATEEKATASEAQWLLNTRHTTALSKAKEALIQARIAAQENALEECVALELQTALSALGEIIGETSTEDLLGEVFSRFCIGK